MKWKQEYEGLKYKIYFIVFIRFLRTIYENFLKWALIIFAAFIVLGIIFSEKDTDNSSTNTAEVVATETELPVEITAQELFREYQANEVAANLKYKGRELKITGVIDSIQAGLYDEPIIVLIAGGEFDIASVQADLKDSEHDKAVDLRRRQQITLICVGASEVLGDPMLENCLIQ